MIRSSRFFLALLALSAMLLSACGGIAVATDPGGSKGLAAPIQYTGVLESMISTQWVVNGQTITVDPSVVRDGPFQVGDTIKVGIVVNPDGSLTVSRVGAPSAADLSGLPPLGNDNSNSDNANHANSNDVNSNDANSNDATGGEVLGTVEAITDTSITIDGQTFNFQAGAEIKGDIVVGAFVKIHLKQNADGTVTVSQLELSDPSQIGNDNSNSENSNSNNDNSSNGGNDNGDDGGDG